ncbi:MAG: hypothetical protein LW705_01555 [Comamonadaceae bacterium]|nr:hypothetical protein [Comamonadaceae bacterium]
MNAPHELPLQAEVVATQENYVGQSVPRSGAKKLLEGRGTYLDDIRLPRLVHVVYLRSPHAHARIMPLHLKERAGKVKPLRPLWRRQDVKQRTHSTMLLWIGICCRQSLTWKPRFQAMWSFIPS